MLCRVLQSERLKGCRSPVWLVFLILPLFPALLDSELPGQSGRPGKRLV